MSCDEEFVINKSSNWNQSYGIRMVALTWQHLKTQPWRGYIAQGRWSHSLQLPSLHVGSRWDQTNPPQCLGRERHSWGSLRECRGQIRSTTCMGKGRGKGLPCVVEVGLVALNSGLFAQFGQRHTKLLRCILAKPEPIQSPAESPSIRSPMGWSGCKSRL